MICSQIKIKYYNDFLLTNFNTLKINARASEFWIPDNSGEMVSLLKKYKNNSPIILGMGSNVLFSSIKIENPIIYTGSINKISLQKDVLTAEAGVKSQYLSKFALSKSLSGFEFLIGIPSTIAGCVFMNASAHKQAIADTFLSAKVYDYELGKIIELKKEDMDFSYRHSILKQKPYVLLSAKFKLQKKENDLIKSKMDENLLFRKNNQPNLSLPNCGSVFKNPANCEFSAGALIDKAGFRGFKSDNCEVYQNHCNFIINSNNATSVDYTNIMFKVYSKVKEKFNVELEPEVIFLGKMTKGEEEKWKIMKKN